MAMQIPNRATTIEEIDSEDASSLITLSKYQRASIAEDTLNKLTAGCYRPHRGPQIDFEKDVAFCVDNSILYTEDDLEDTEKLISTGDESGPISITTATSSYAKIEVRHCTTLQAAQSLVTEMGEDRVGVLNFASAKNPGGGFLRGANAQEESLARSSSLYPALTQDRFSTGFYGHNRRGKTCIHSHRIIYSPKVIVFKDDNGKLLCSPYHVGIVTAPAPNASVVREAEVLKNAMTERIKRLLYVFKANKHDTLVLGAFGCGVFQNSPLDVAITFRQHLESDQFKNSFKRIVFAVLDARMCQVFEKVFAATDLNRIQQEVAAKSPNNGDNKQYPCNNRNQQYKKVAKPRRNRNSGFEQVHHNKSSTNYNDEVDDE